MIDEIRVQPKFEPGKYYSTVVEIAQINPESLLAQWRVTSDAVFSFAVFGFEKVKFESITTEEGDTLQIVGQFKGYQQIGMKGGAQKRLPIFKLTGFRNLSRNTFFSFE